MKFDYKGLWKILIDKNMIKKDLMEKTGMSPTTMAKISKGEPINMQILWKICNVLDVDIGDVVCIDRNSEESYK